MDKENKMSNWNLPMLNKARDVVRTKAPYFTTTMYKLRPIEVPGMGTLGVDAELNMYYDPDAFGKLPLIEAASHIVHELLHILYRYHDRAKHMGIQEGVDALVWNMAADIAMFSALDEGGWKFKHHLTPSQFKFPKNLATEEYYRLLYKNIKTPAVTKMLKQYDKPQAYPGRGRSGSCASGIPEPWETTQPKGEGALHRELLCQTFAREVREAKARGDIPGNSILELAESITAPPKVSWRRLIGGAVRGALSAPGKVDYTRSHPSRRQQCTPDVLRPALVQPIPKIAVVLDSSGSMSQTNLTDALIEIRGVLQALGIASPVSIIVCDSAVHAGVQSIWKVSQITISGGGGTDMGVGLREAVRARPDLVIVATDGYTNWPRCNPCRCPAIVLLIGNDSASLHTVPKWARGVRVDDK